MSDLNIVHAKRLAALLEPQLSILNCWSKSKMTVLDCASLVSPLLPSPPCYMGNTYLLIPLLGYFSIPAGIRLGALTAAALSLTKSASKTSFNLYSQLLGHCPKLVRSILQSYSMWLTPGCNFPRPWLSTTFSMQLCKLCWRLLAMNEGSRTATMKSSYLVSYKTFPLSSFVC